MRQEQRVRHARLEQRQGGPAAALRREAMRERPEFSAELHRRLAERLEVSPQRHLPEASSRAPSGGRRGRSQRGRWLVTASRGAISLLASLGLVGRFWDGTGPAERLADGRLATVLAGREVGQSGTAETPATAEVSIDRLPMFDEIGDGVVEGVTTLAVSLLDVPDLAMLADLGASVAEGDQAGR